MRKPLLIIGAVVVCLIMLRLGVWQLDRAEQKQLILDQTLAQASQAPISLDHLLLEKGSDDLDGLRFRQVLVSGAYLPDHSILIDNQVVDSQVGYLVMTPFRSEGGTALMVKRGWIPVGASRDIKPTYPTPAGPQKLRGRLVNPVAKPPLWDEQYPVFEGAVWQYLPLEEFAEHSELSVLPLVLELAPDSDQGDGLVRQWPIIDDKWVAKHHGYAFQWFAMAAVFSIACLVLLIKNIQRR
ncbi:MAG: SURF1 family protein [Arenicella sp.]|nr:SURF1 family protein [Arenicella sp.]